MLESDIHVKPNLSGVTYGFEFFQLLQNIVFAKVMVLPRCILNGGTVPPWCILNGGTVPPFNLFQNYLLNNCIFAH